MCGIGGFRMYGKTKVTQDNLDVLLVGLEKRGNDATGLAIMRDDNELVVIKDDEAASKFVNSFKYKDFCKDHLANARTIIAHTRFASVGSPRKNDNNHPMFKGKCALVHNGGISNHEYLFNDLKLDRSCETDSDILRAIIDEEGFTKKAIRTLNRCSGPAAIAALNPEMPEHLLLARSGSPLVCAKYQDMLVFASEKTYIHRAMRPWEDWKKLWFQQQKIDIGFLTMADHTAWILGPDGVEWHDAFKTCFNEYLVDRFRPTYTGHESRNAKWGKDKEEPKSNVSKDGKLPAIVFCVCGRKFKIKEADRDKKLWQFRCNNKDCNRLLAEKPVN